MDSFTVAVLIGVLVVLGILVALIFADKGAPPPDAGKASGHKGS